MEPVTRIRNALQRWLGGEKSTIAVEPATKSRQQIPNPAPSSDSERLASFIKKVREQSQDWLGRVRLINFHAIQERLEDKWPRLEERVELLADRIIQEQLSGRDLYLNLGGAEFLLYIADAGPEEIKIRCQAIIESIEEKLFGVDDQVHDAKRYAECHVAQVESLDLDWATAVCGKPADPTSQGRNRSALRSAFRPEAEILDWLDVGTSVHSVIDTIIAHAKESRTIDELGPIVERLKHLARSQKILEGTLLKRKDDPNWVAIAAGDTQSLRDCKESDHKRAIAAAQLLHTAGQDTAELISILDVESDSAFSIMLAALANMQRARESRRLNASGDQVAGYGAHRDRVGLPAFEYVPVYRFVAQGEQVYQGINRIDVELFPQITEEDSHRATAENEYQRCAAAQQMQLEHALRCLLDMGAGARFLFMVPIHVDTLYRPYWFSRYCNTLRAAHIQSRRKLIIDIIGYRETDNTIAVRRAIDVLRMQTRAVFVSTLHQTVSGLRKIAAECKGLGIHALGMDMTAYKGSEMAMLSEMGCLSAIKFQYGMATYVTGIGEPGLLENAVANGVSYVCAPALHPPRATPLEIKRTSLAEIMNQVKNNLP